ncbi:MAG TPA: membrane protein insertion efficiency factor YidD [Mycobacteriales bacterium]|nr:membrane protein insertion efficiency factor YidD [Mycobacteriales bacterium]
MTTSTIDARVTPRKGVIAWVLVGVLRTYQRVVSPLFMPSCRFYPTCSSYAVTAVTEHGALRGGWLALRRIGRCHPFHPGGIDPVPPADRAE